MLKYFMLDFLTQTQTNGKFAYNLSPFKIKVFKNKMLSNWIIDQLCSKVVILQRLYYIFQPIKEICLHVHIR